MSDSYFSLSALLENSQSRQLKNLESEDRPLLHVHFGAKTLAKPSPCVLHRFFFNRRQITKYELRSFEFGNYSSETYSCKSFGIICDGKYLSTPKNHETTQFFVAIKVCICLSFLPSGSKRLHNFSHRSVCYGDLFGRGDEDEERWACTFTL